MSDKTYKNIFNNGYTTYHDDGTKSETYKNVFNDGTTTYHSDGSKSETYKNIFNNGTTTYHSDGSKSETYKNIFNNGYTTYHSDGSRSETFKDIFGGGYTTYNYGGSSSPPVGFHGSGGYSGGYSGVSSIGAGTVSFWPAERSAYDIICPNVIMIILLITSMFIMKEYSAIVISFVLLGYILSQINCDIVNGPEIKSFCTYIGLVEFVFYVIRRGIYDGKMEVVIAIAFITFLFYVGINVEFEHALIAIAAWAVPRISYHLMYSDKIDSEIPKYIVIIWGFVAFGMFVRLCITNIKQAIKDDKREVKQELKMALVGIAPILILSLVSTSSYMKTVLGGGIFVLIASVIVCAIMAKKGKYSMLRVRAFKIPLVLFTMLGIMSRMPSEYLATFKIEKWFFSNIIGNGFVRGLTSGVYGFYEFFADFLNGKINDNSVYVLTVTIAGLYLILMDTFTGLLRCENR